MSFGRWKKSLNVNAAIFPVSEIEAYTYVRELREHNAPRTKPARFLEALSFSYHMLGAEVDNAMHSPRVRGAAITPLVVPRKKTPLSFPQVAMFEKLAMDDAGQVGIFAGYICMILHMRLRWSDGQYSQHEPSTDIFQGRGFLECQLYHHKNAGRQKQAKRLLPAACVIPGFSGEDCATSWLDHRVHCGLRAGPGVPTMPAPLASGGWAFESGDTLDEGAAEELSSIATSDGDRNTLPQGHGPEHDGESRLQWRLEEAGRVSCGPWLEDGT
jgi:hypothetical protein